MVCDVNYSISVLIGVKLSQHILERMISFTLMASLLQKATGKGTGSDIFIILN